MGIQIDVTPEEAWNLYQLNKSKLVDQMVVIAENTDTKYAVYMTDDRNLPLFAVCKGDEEPEYKEGAVNAKDCEQTLKDIYKHYLFPISLSVSEKKETAKESIIMQSEIEDISYKRSEELRTALLSFLTVALDTKDEDPEGDAIILEYGVQLVDEILERFLEYLAYEQGFEIFYPISWTDDETGAEMCSMYPFNEDSYDSVIEACDGNCANCDYIELCQPDPLERFD